MSDLNKSSNHNSEVDLIDSKSVINGDTEDKASSDDESAKL